MREYEVPLGLQRAARLALLPWRSGWMLASRFGLLGEPPVGTLPHLDPDALARWRAEMERTRVYLEYGSGGSTLAAISRAEHVVTVESDAGFLSAVRRMVEEAPDRRATFAPLHVDIGRTEKWGRPLIEWASGARLAKWRRYSALPWDYLEERSLKPDFVFVDGRFRVACALESLLRLPDAATPIMLDDYARRTRAYRAVHRFADTERVGRALILRRRSEFDRAACLTALAAAQRDPE